MKQHLSLIPIEKIFSSSHNYIKSYSSDEIEQLANSIRHFGLIEPLIVRKKYNHYVIVCGERRYKACKKARLQKVPCIIVNYTNFHSNTINFNGNYFVKSLNYKDKYNWLKAYQENWNLSVEECATLLNLKLSAIEELMQLSRLTENHWKIINNSELTKEQVYISLKITNNELREKFLQFITERNYNLAQTEECYKQIKDYKNKQKSKAIITTDTRLIVNTVNKAVENIRKNGVSIDCTKTEKDDNFEYLLTIKKPVLNIGE